MKQGTAEWLHARRSGLGGSEISCLYLDADGQPANPWMTQTRLWGEKTGRIEVTQPTPHERPELYIGAVLEPAVREMYQTFAGRKVSDGVTMLRHPEVPCMMANTDGEVEAIEGRDGPGVYEGKASSAWMKSKWYADDGSPNIPLHYQLQVQHYLACTGLTWASLAVFFGGDRQPVKWFDIERHDAIISDLCERSARWWRDHVEADKPPPLDATQGTEDAMRKMHPTDDGRFVRLPAGFDAVLNMLDTTKRMVKMAEAEAQRLRNLVIATMGTAAYAETPSGRGFTYRAEGSRGRVLRVASAERIDRVRRDTGCERPPPAIVPGDVAVQVDSIEGLAWSRGIFSGGSG